MRKRRDMHPASIETMGVPRLVLTHGQAIWLLCDLGFDHGVKRSTFNYYVKSLRKLGVPFDPANDRSSGRRRITYGFDEMMELSLALLLRVYGTLPDAVTTGLQKFRDQLRPIYHQAYLDLLSPRYPSASISMVGANRVLMSGLYLDLNLRYAAGQMVTFGPPRTLSPFEALCIYVQSEASARSYLPINISSLAGLVLARSKQVPAARRGRRPKQS